MRELAIAGPGRPSRAISVRQSQALPKSTGRRAGLGRELITADAELTHDWVKPFLQLSSALQPIS
jgi:hypothetical protein